MSLGKIEQLYWDKYRQEKLGISVDVYVRASMAGNEEIADELLNLYLEGKKTAGSGFVKDYLLSGDELPKVGDYWIVMDSQKKRCILKIVQVEICRFDEVSEKVAIAEGEGD